MRVIGEFKDLRNGKRYFPGDGNSISPALTDDQVQHLKKAGCLAEGDEAVKASISAAGNSAGNEQKAAPDYSAMTVADLKNLAGSRNLDIGTVKNKADLVAVHVTADAAEAEASQQGGQQQEAGK